MTKRPLSFWGWGYSDRFPDTAAREALKDQMEQLFGFVGLTVCELPTADSIEVPEPRFEPPRGMKKISSTHDVNRAAHTYGKSYRDVIRGLSGDFSKAPDFIVYPRNEKEVSKVIRWCAQESIAVVPFGGGTSVVGGVECSGKLHDGVISLDMRALKGLIDLDDKSMTARFHAGTTGRTIEDELKKHGFSLGHFPQSFEFSTLGGWIATRCAGHRSMKHSRIDDLVQSLRMVSPQGEIVTLSVPSSGAGPDANRFVFGSEGAFGVITEATVRVCRRKKYRSSVAIGFDTFFAGVEVVRQIAQSGLFPETCSLLDKSEALIYQLESDGRHLLLLGFSSSDSDTKANIERAIEIALRGDGLILDGPFFRDGGEPLPESSVGGRWRQTFFDAPYLHSTLASVGVIIDSFETSTTWERFPALYAAVQRSVSAAIHRTCGVRGVLSCRLVHAYADGPAPMFTVMAPARAGQEVNQWGEIRWAAQDVLIEQKATLSHNRGVGRLHRPWFEQEVSPLYRKTLQMVKQTVDPTGVMNPGCLIDLPKKS